MKATETIIKNFIGGLDKAFVIPPFQRNYSWGKPECLELFNDIISSMKNKTQHYLGNIIYYCGENNGASYTEYILIDGQQRVTSILLLLCALRDVCNDDIIKSDINRKYLLNDTSDDRYRIRLKQIETDAEIFENIVDSKQTSIQSHIIENYNFF